MKNTVILLLSSPEGESNYFSGLMNATDSKGKLFFNVIICQQICEECQKLERIKQIECNHVPNPAPWLSSKKMRELKLLYKANPEDALREFGGLVISNYKPALRKEEVQQMFSAEPVLITTTPPYIFTACDPNGGGPSQMSICSGIFLGTGEFVIVGLDSEPVRDDQEEFHMLHRHFERLFRFRWARESKVIFIPENNLGLEAAHLDSMVRDIPRVQTFWQKDDRPGVRKDGSVTRDYQFLLATVLACKTCRIAVDLFTTSRDKTSASILGLLQEQMLRYHWERKPANDVHGKDRYTLTGKVGDQQDDLLISFVMAMYWGRIIMTTARDRIR